jgi:hypothetical protein
MTERITIQAVVPGLHERHCRAEPAHGVTCGGNVESGQHAFEDSHFRKTNH